MGYLAAFIVGALLGWVVAWALQKRLDDNLIDEVAQLQRQIVDYQREIEDLQDPTALNVEEEPEAAVRDTVAVAAVTAEAEAGEVVEEEEPVADSDEEPVAEAADAESAEPESAESEPIETQEAVETEQEEVVTQVEGGAAEELLNDLYPDVAEEESEQDDAPAPASLQPAGADDFTKMRGVGPKFAETLYSAGITTYADLANASPEQLQEIVQPAAWHKVDFEDWIVQANELANQG